MFQHIKDDLQGQQRETEQLEKSELLHSLMIIGPYETHEKKIYIHTHIYMYINTYINMTLGELALFLSLTFRHTDWMYHHLSHIIY